MSYEQILYEIDDHVLRLTCNRPNYRNAQSRRLLEELDDAFARAAEEVDIRVIVLMGSGEHFSAGHDLGTPEEMADRDERPRQEGIRGRFYLNVARTKSQSLLEPHDIRLRGHQASARASRSSFL